MLTLKNGVQVKTEASNVVKVVEIEPCGFDSNGEAMFQSYCLSKKHHKGSLLLDGVAII